MTYPPPPGQPGAAPQYGYAQPPAPTKGRGLAITSLVLGILGCIIGLIPILGFVSFPLGAIGIVFGLIGLTGKRDGKGMSIAGTILSVLAIVLAVIGLVIVNKAVNDVSDSLDNISGGSTQEILKNDLDVSLGGFTTDRGGYLETGKLVVTLRNKASEAHSFSVKVEATDASGTRIADDTVFASDLAAGQSATEDAFTLATSDKLEGLKAAKFTVVEASKY